MDLALDAAQEAVVRHEGGALRVLGTFGAGTSRALRARAERQSAMGKVPLLVHQRELVPFAVDLLRRHGRVVARATTEERRSVLAAVVEERDQPHLADIARAVVGFQTSWLGDEELRVHADAAGELERAERLIAVTHHYLDELDERHLVDEGGAVVQAGLALRDDDVLHAERARFGELLVDDFQLATFAEQRLVTQLVGRGGALVVAGNPGAAISSAPLASSTFLLRFDRRFACPTIELTTAHRRPQSPRLHLAGDEADAQAAAAEAVAGGATALSAADVEGAVGREWPQVVVLDAVAGRWPRPRPRNGWFDEELFHGPDVPDGTERDRRWHEAERRRFGVAISRASERTTVIASADPTPFLAELVD